MSKIVFEDVQLLIEFIICVDLVLKHCPSLNQIPHTFPKDDLF